jgi:hypothetical protein
MSESYACCVLYVCLLCGMCDDVSRTTLSCGPTARATMPMDTRPPNGPTSSTVGQPYTSIEPIPRYTTMRPVPPIHHRSNHFSDRRASALYFCVFEGKAWKIKIDTTVCVVGCVQLSPHVSLLSLSHRLSIGRDCLVVHAANLFPVCVCGLVGELQPRWTMRVGWARATDRCTSPGPTYATPRPNPWTCHTAHSSSSRYLCG